MKTIDDYTIHCTETQTKKAFELGASLNTPPVIHMDNKKNKENHFVHCMKGNPVVESGYRIVPTGEQMIGWLEDQECIKEISVYCDVTGSNWYFDGYKNNGDHAFASRDSYYSRKEATLAAIDAALEYLSNYVR